MKNHVVSLDLAKKLKEAGYPQESEFYWEQRDDQRDSGRITRKKDLGQYNKLTYVLLPYAAPLATELLERLPKECKIENREGYLLIEVDVLDGSWTVGYYDDEYNYIQAMGEEGQPLPDALAEMALWLVKEGHLKF